MSVSGETSSSMQTGPQIVHCCVPSGHHRGQTDKWLEKRSSWLCYGTDEGRAKGPSGRTRSRPASWARRPWGNGQTKILWVEVNISHLHWALVGAAQILWLELNKVGASAYFLSLCSPNSIRTLSV